MGLDPANGGRVTVDGREVHGCGHDRGMVFQHAELLPWLSAMQNVMFGLEMKGMRGQPLRDTAKKYLDLVGLTDSQNRRPHQLSGGMKQRVGIARALAIDPIGAADGRAVRRARRADARVAAGRAPGNPRPHQEDHPVRHPRPRRSGADRRPHRGHEATAACRRSSSVPLTRPRADLEHRARPARVHRDPLQDLAHAARDADGALNPWSTSPTTQNKTAAPPQPDAARTPPAAALGDHARLGRRHAGAVGDFRPPHQSGVRLLSAAIAVAFWELLLTGQLGSALSRACSPSSSATGWPS